MLYRQSQQLIVEGEERLREGDVAAARDAFRRAGELQWQLVETRAADRVRTRSVFGLSAATLFKRAGDRKRAEEIAGYLLAQEWLDTQSRVKLRALLNDLQAEIESLSNNGLNNTGGYETSGIRDNHRRGTVGDFLVRAVNPGAYLSVVSAYFTIYAFDALRERLEQIEHIDFLFGEPRFIRSLDPSRTESKAFSIQDEGLQLRQSLEQKRVARECANWIKEKADIRSVRQSGFLHGKMYHVANGTEKAILGSSNFTMSGLGLADRSNIELNVEIDNPVSRADLKAWFDEIWSDTQLVEDVKDEVLLYLSQLYQNHSPEFVYFKTLFHVFERFLSKEGEADWLNQQMLLANTEIWKWLFEFQRDGVRGVISKILTHNGCILADSVGLGKTFEALAVIKYFEMRNGRVLVLCPKKLRENWTVYQGHLNSELNPFLRDKFSYTVLSHTDLTRHKGLVGDVNLETINWGNYDLVVIDESHNFRNNAPGRRDEQGNLTRPSRYQWLMDRIIQDGLKTRVLLLSATPVNNDLRDLRNQIYLITADDDRAFQESIGISSIKETLGSAQRTFNEWAAAQKGQPRSVSGLLEKLNSALFTLLDALTIARSRKHIQKYYAKTLEAVGNFPRRLKPISLFPDIDILGRFISYDRLNDEISNYRLSLFNPSGYVLPQHKERYQIRTVENFTQQQREHFLIGMMKVNYLKRLESSVNSFAISMNRTVERIERLEKQITAYQDRKSSPSAVASNDVEVLDLIPDDLAAEFTEDEDTEDAAEVGSKLKYRLDHLDVGTWLRDLRQDKQQLSILYEAARGVTPDRDAKLQELKRLIAEKVEHPGRDACGRPNQKILVFTAFADTAVYLYESIVDWARHELGIHAALVTGGSTPNRTTFGETDFNRILVNFSPRSKQRDRMGSMPQEGQIDLLIATDCISEGQNLQDCDTVINYDIHWNPVRLIQRFGRIDRIGSINTAVQMVNFWPTDDLNRYINLKNRVEARMALVDLAATSQDNILSNDEIRELIHDDLNYRDKQLLRLKDEVIDLEDLDESVSLTEFTLDDFRIELARYLEANRKLLESAPLGLYAVVPTDPKYHAIVPGVIFCVRQRGDSSGGEAVNPLQPYFLIYVKADGAIHYTFTHAKRILEILRAVCAGKTVPYEDLCNLFDEQTRNGSDMGAYNSLLDSAVSAVASTFRKRIAHGLTTSRSALVPEAHQQIHEFTDFDLVTWIVIQ